ncbi:MAG TPA: DnaB-like helicase C-terminal domain-containing protein, partial [Gemmatimonadales bacterium]|nr:DnaB-like helicase C-terminal domain-containing protein [Gemmatimonadales bacterium]
MKPRDADASLEAVVARIDAVPSGGTSPDTVVSGFPSLDRVLGGGFRRQDLIVLGGDVGSGKSALGLAIAMRAALAGTPTLFLSGEMSAERVLERALAIEGRVSVDDIRTGKLDDVSWASLGAAAVKLRDRAPQVDRLVAGGVPALTDDLRRRLDLELAICDSLQAVASGSRNRDEELAATMRELKLLAVETDVAIIVTTQLTELPRDRADMRPQL